MNTCLTKPLTHCLSTCLATVSDCPFLAKFGFSRICTHPDHKKFSCRGTNQQVHINESKYV